MGVGMASANLVGGGPAAHPARRPAWGQMSAQSLPGPLLPLPLASASTAQSYCGAATDTSALRKQRDAKVLCSILQVQSSLCVKRVHTSHMAGLRYRCDCVPTWCILLLQGSRALQPGSGQQRLLHHPGDADAAVLAPQRCMMADVIAIRAYLLALRLSILVLLQHRGFESAHAPLRPANSRNARRADPPETRSCALWTS